MGFEEIIFEAETDRNEYPEFDQESFNLCEEDPSARLRNIDELRNMILERGECQPYRMDDAFLLRFLRARRSIPARAHRLLIRYCKFREQNPQLWRGVYWYEVARLGHIFEGVLYDRPDVGRLIISRLGLWDPEQFPAEELIRGGLVMLEVGILQPKLQLLGGTALIDCEGLTVSQWRHFTPSLLLHTMNILGLAFPLYQRGIHVINCPRMLQTAFSLFKRMMPADDLCKMVYFHGYDLDSLHRYIAPECLPKRYGGLREAVSFEKWLTKIKQYKKDTFDEEMKVMGYSV